MSENNINAFCSICGRGYHVCNSCLSQKTFKPWRTVTDSIEHYKIYLTIHEYSISKDKEKAKNVARNELNNCDLSELESFKPKIQSIIKEIMEESKKEKHTTVKKKENAESNNIVHVNKNEINE